MSHIADNIADLTHWLQFGETIRERALPAAFAHSNLLRANHVKKQVLSWRRLSLYSLNTI